MVSESRALDNGMEPGLAGRATGRVDLKPESYSARRVAPVGRESGQKTAHEPTIEDRMREIAEVAEILCHWAEFIVTPNSKNMGYM